MKVDENGGKTMENGCKWIKVDRKWMTMGGNGWNGMKMNESGRKLLKVGEMDEIGWKGMKAVEMDESGWILMKANENGWKWPDKKCKRLRILPI